MLAVVAVASVLATPGCAAPPAPSAERLDVTLGGVPVVCRVADDPTERGAGLQGYDPLAPGEGMLFVFDGAEVRTFAMKDVAFPIDVIFIAEDMNVSAIESLDPGEERLVTSPGPCPYVVELPQGWAADEGIGIGAALVIGD